MFYQEYTFYYYRKKNIYIGAILKSFDHQHKDPNCNLLEIVRFAWGKPGYYKIKEGICNMKAYYKTHYIKTQKNLSIGA